MRVTQKGVQIVVLSAGTKTELVTAFSTLAPRNAEALLVGSDPVFNNWREQLVALASHYAIPAMHEWRESCCDRRSGQVRTESKFYPARSGGLRREDSQRRETGGSSGAAADQVRVCHQSENR